ncbi:HAD-IIB family hydrolase [Lentzea sp. NPDC058450]|uniref:HAD-IIB family hydrolase n=1 Tax=Lentzea sp. NPDC058450 TaxID=3346505 RepID=UPI003656F315
MTAAEVEQATDRRAALVPALVAMDLDGTLLRSDGTLSGGSVAALTSAAATGLRVVFATARPVWAAVPVVRDAGAGDYLISSNGAVVSEMASGRVVRTTAMPASVAGAVAAALAVRCPEAVWAADRVADRIVSPSWPDLLASTAERVVRAEHVPPGAGVLCLMVVGCPAELGHEVAREFGVGCTSSSAGLLEFSAPGADKRSALLWVLERLGLPADRVVAYGDAPNDLAMLGVAGTSVAVGNAHEDVRRAAGVVVASNDEDGVARHLEELTRQARTRRTPEGLSMIVSAYGSAPEVPAADWDSLRDRATTYSASGWLGVREEELPGSGAGRHLVARDAHGPAAGMETYAFTEPPHRLYAPTFLLEGLVDDDRAAAYEREPFVFGAGWSEFRGQIPVRPGLSEAGRAAAVGALAADTLAWAADRQAHLLSYLYLPLEQALDVARAHADAEPVVVLQDVENVLRTDWADFSDYLAWLPRNRRTRVRRELRDFEESGRKVRECALAEVVDVIAPLNNALMQKYGHTWFSLERALAVYDRQARHLSADSSVLLVEDEGRPAAFALRYRRDDRLYSRVVGFDYDLPNRSDYFNILMYDAVRNGAERGIAEINLGVGTYEAKLGRGALPVPLYSVFVGVREPLPVTAQAVRAHNRRKVTAFAEESGRFVVGGLDVEAWMPERGSE